MKRLTICIAATAALVTPAAAQAGEKFYGGEISQGGKIGVDVTTVGGKPFQVDAMRYKRLPATCTNGQYLIGATWTLADVLVEDNKFEVDATTPGGDNIFFKGTFRKGGRKLTGRFQEGPSNFGFPAGTCTSANRTYEAKRGGNGPHPQARKAFRLP